MFRKCEEHGWVWRRSSKHCPACGEELLVLPIYPFKIYISKGTLGILLCAVVVVALGWKLPAYTSTLESMPSQWHSLYVAIQVIPDAGRRLKALQGFMGESGSGMPPMTSSQIGKFARLFKTGDAIFRVDKSYEAFVLLQPYILSAEPNQ